MNIEKFVEEHKKEIITVSAIAGGTLALIMSFKAGKKYGVFTEKKFLSEALFNNYIELTSKEFKNFWVVCDHTSAIRGDAAKIIKKEVEGAPDKFKDTVMVLIGQS